MADGHIPVLVDEVLGFLVRPDGGRLVDGTVGLGGHAGALLDAMPEAELLGLDRDADALSRAEAHLRPHGDRVQLVRTAFSQLAEAARQVGWDRVDGILLDIGVSSLQIDDAARGFSYRRDGPLDMRMDRRGRTTAAMILNRWSEGDLTHLFRTLGEERRARRVSRAVVERREQRPWERTGEFAALLEDVVGAGRRRGPPPAARCFQALRIAVNRELDELRDGLRAARGMLAPGGRLVVISFHSLEDRIVKRFFRHEAADCVCPPGLPECVCGKVVTLEVLTRKPVRPAADEVEANRRAAPARLRAAQKVQGGSNRCPR